MFIRDWTQLQQLITENDLAAAESLIKKMHGSYQQQALLHARIHFIWGRIAWLRKKYFQSVFQYSVAAVLAVPVSITRKIFQ